MYETVRIVSVLSQIVVLAAGLYARYSLAREMKILILYFGVALLADVAGISLSMKGINNLWLFHFFAIFEFGFLIYIFSIWQRNLFLKKILKFSIPLFAVMGIIVTLVLENIQQFNSFSQPVASLALVGVAAYTLFELNKESFNSVFRQPRFWIGAGVMLYFSGTLVLFSLGNVLLDASAQWAKTIFILSVIMNIVANLLYTGGFLCQVQKPG